MANICPQTFALRQKHGGKPGGFGGRPQSQKQKICAGVWLLIDWLVNSGFGSRLQLSFN